MSPEPTGVDTMKGYATYKGRVDRYSGEPLFRSPSTPPEGWDCKPSKPRTWGDTLKGRGRVQVLRVEACTQSKPMPGGGIDGELYTADCRRGNLLTRVIRNGTPKRPLGFLFKSHPFTRSALGATVSDALPVRVYLGKRQGIGEGEPANTEVTVRAPEAA